MAHRSPKNPLDFGGNPDQVTLGLMLVRIRVTVDVPCHIGRTVLRLSEAYPQHWACFIRPLFNSNKGDCRALVAVCTLLSALY